MELRQLISLMVLLLGLAAAIFAAWRFASTNNNGNTSSGGSSSTSEQQPNLVFILADDVGWNDIGYRNPEMKTPVMDQLANDGVIFDKYYTEFICTPSRAALLTGKYPMRYGLTHVPLRPGEPNCLDLNQTMLPEKLQDAGYNTHMIGKWHLGYFNESCLPINRGFDTSFGFYTQGEDYYDKQPEGTAGRPPSCGGNMAMGNPGRPMPGYDFMKDDEPYLAANGSYSTFEFQDRAVQLIEDHDDNDGPMFMYLSFSAPHSPLQAPQEYIDMYNDIEDDDRRIFSAMMTAMDDAIGKVVQALKDQNMYDNTLIVFSTDNGGDTTWGANNAPLRGQKTTLWEGGIRGVAFASGGRVKNGGRVSDELIYISDWFPTFLEAAGVEKEDMGDDLDSFSVWQHVSEDDGETERTEILHGLNPLFFSRFVWFQCGKNLFPSAPVENPYGYDTTRGHGAYRMGKWKLLTGDPGPFLTVPAGVNAKNASVRAEICANDPMFNVTGMYRSVYLFDIEADPTELTNVADENEDIVMEMIGKLQSYTEQAVPYEFRVVTCDADPALFGGVYRPWGTFEDWQ